MAAERTYYVIPAEVIREHARPVPAPNRWKAWRRARKLGASGPAVILTDRQVADEWGGFVEGAQR